MEWGEGMSTDDLPENPTPAEILERNNVGVSTKSDSDSLSKDGYRKAMEILDYMEELFDTEGKEHFKSKVMEENIDYSSKQIGHFLGTINSAYKSVREEYAETADDGLPDDLKNRKGLNGAAWKPTPLFEYDDLRTDVENVLSPDADE